VSEILFVGPRIGNDHHTEIKFRILEFALVAGVVEPCVVTCNWKPEWASFGYSILYEGHEIRNCRENVYDRTPTVYSLPRQDANGDYFELRDVFRSQIDATFLRTCQDLYSTGIKMLYGQNDFYFQMRYPGFHSCPPSLIAKGTLLQPNSDKLPLNDSGWQQAVTRVISEIERQVPITYLSEWTYYDPFLRFIYTIGPRNAALLRSLNFSGTVKIHYCMKDICKKEKCPDDLVASVRLYFPFINVFCTSLEKLTLLANEDTFRPHPLELGEPANRKEALIPLLKNELKGIITLTEVVVQGSWVHDHGLDWVDNELGWLRKRNAEKLAEAVEEQKRFLREALVAEEIKCEFCGEKHVWAECPNLCNFCGAFGHFRQGCPALAS